MAFARRPFPAGDGRRRGGADEPASGRQVDTDPEQTARQICLNQLEHAPRTRAELAARLSDRGVADDVAQTVLGRFTEVGLVDDTAFAQAWVTSRHRGRGLAGRALGQELRRKGVDDDIVREAVAGLDPEQEAATARALVARRLSSSLGLAPEVRVRRLAGMLARKGYPSGLAFAVVREALAREGDEIDRAFDELQALED